MKIKPYIDYLRYVREHRKNVRKVAFSRKMYWHGLTHDLSKYLPDEFIPYAKYFYISKVGNTGIFNSAWEKHFTRNKHHWQHWVGTVMPIKYIQQMIVDWEAMSLKFGGSAKEYYLSNKLHMELNPVTRLVVELHFKNEIDVFKLRRK